MSGVIHVAAGALVDGHGRVLIAQRHAQAHQGGLWEFPGGKLEPGEDGETALRRELREELGVKIRTQRPLIRIEHAYPDRRVVLHVFLVNAWEGEPRGREGQPLAWVMPAELGAYPMPAADVPVVTALGLPERYLITPPRIEDASRFLQYLDGLLDQGLRLIQYRVFDTGDADPVTLLQAVERRCRSAGATVMQNVACGLAARVATGGLHLNTRQLLSGNTRPVGFERVSASCHSQQDLRQAEALGLDFAVLSLVLPTRSHPDADPLGWDRFSRIVGNARIPVYALGGMHNGLLAQAWQSGAQGIAGIRGFWGDETL